MSQSVCDSWNRPARGQRLHGMLLAGLVLALPSPGPAQEAGGPGGAPKTPARANSCASARCDAAQPDSFELACLPPGSKGVVVIHPAAVFRQPGMEPYARMLNQELTGILGHLGLKSVSGPKVEEIEEVVGTLTLRYDESKPREQRGSMMMVLSLVRTVKPFDWKKWLRDLGADLVEVHEKGQTYYRLSHKQGTLLSSLMGLPKGGNMYFLFPDPHTLVSCPGGDPASMSLRAARGEHSFDWAGDWKHVAHCLAAILFTTSEVRSYPRAKELGDMDSAPFFRDVRHWALGIDYTDRWRFEAFAGCPTEKASVNLVRACKALLVLIQKEIDAGKGPRSQQGPEATCDCFAKTLIEHARIEREGTTVRVHADARGPFGEVVDAFIKAANAP